MALSLGWRGAADTDLDFSEFYSSDYTILAWFMLQYPRAYTGPILAVNGTGVFLVGQGDYNTVGSSGQAHLVALVEGSRDVFIPATLDAGQWYHLALVHQGTQFRLFLNGQGMGNPLSLTGSKVPSGKLRFGRPAPGVGVDNQEAQFFGLLDEVAVYSQALPVTEIVSRFSNRSLLNGGETGLVAGWVLSPAPPAGLPATLTRPIALTGEAAVVNTALTPSDIHSIPLPRCEATELPFLAGEAWQCTQGTAAAFSHRGFAAFCWDFVIADVGDDWNQEYPTSSFKAPIFSAGPGDVLTVSDFSPPGPVSEPETENQILVRHGDGLIRAYLHLLKHTARPFEGQSIYDGQPIARICTEWRDANRPIPHLHFAGQPDSSDMIGFVTVPTVFKNYEVRNPDNSWSFVPRGIPQQGDVVRRTGRRLWIVDARASSYTFLTPPSLMFKVISQAHDTVSVTIDVRLDGGPFQTVTSVNFFNTVPAAFVGDWDARQVGANTRYPHSALLFWIGQTAQGGNFFNLNGRFEFRIVARDQDGQESDSVSAFTTIRWHGQRVTCVRKQGNRIASVGGQDADRGAWQLSVGKAIAEIKRGQRFYVEEPAGDRVALIVSYTETDRAYLKTVADGDRPNNLLRLPRCS